ncbi:hypothetical protein FKM82_023581 [Ascaphus truei]
MPHPRWRRSGRTGRGGTRKATLEEAKHYTAPKEKRDTLIERTQTGRGGALGGGINKIAQRATEATPRADNPLTDTPAPAAAPDPCADTPVAPTGVSLNDTPAPLAL